MQESINKHLEELENKHTETNPKLLILKILWKLSIAEYLKLENKSVSWKIKLWK